MSFILNGSLINSEELSVSLSNRGLNYGDGVFESMKFANGRVNFLEDHYFRLMASMRILRMEIPMDFTPEFFDQKIKELIDTHKLGDEAARVKILVVRKAGGLYTPTTNEIDHLITVKPLAQNTYVLNDKGLEVDLFKDYYLQKGLLSNLKTSSSTIYTLASIFAKENNLDECILINDDKRIAEAISANIFLLKGKEVFTPSLSSGCLKGIIRQKAIELLPKLGYEVKEVDDLSPFELQKVDEVFLTNAIKGVQWVEKYKKKIYANNCAAELVKRLNVAAALG